LPKKKKEKKEISVYLRKWLNHYSFLSSANYYPCNSLISAFGLLKTLPISPEPYPSIPPPAETRPDPAITNPYPSVQAVPVTTFFVPLA